MSRVSSKSSLSPSATSGSSAIDLGKDSGVNMGEKSQTSVSTGGIGVTREVANIGGVSVTGGVSVDVSPIRLDISGNPDYEDPSKSSISIGAGAEVPGGVLGVSGGVTINTSTGRIEGGSIGGEVVGIGINISKSSEGVGVGISLQIPFTPISFELGFEFPDKKEPTPTPTPTPAPTPSPSLIPDAPPLPPEVPYFPPGNTNGSCIVVVATTRVIWREQRRNGKLLYQGISVSQAQASVVAENSRIVYTFGTVDASQETFSDGFTRTSNNSYGPDTYDRLTWESSPLVGFSLRMAGYVGRGLAAAIVFSGSYQEIQRYITYEISNFAYTQDTYSSPDGTYYQRIIDTYKYDIAWMNCSIKSVQEPPPFLLPPPNPPPRKQMDECCRDSIKLLRQIHKRLGVNKFPGELPSTIIQEVEKGQPATEPVQEKIEDFADLLMWMFQRDDERWGQWQIQIDVKDTDLTKEGDQGKQIKFPNLAESIAEMEGQLLSLQANVAALVAISTRNLCESGMGRQEAIKAYLASMAIAKYMNFPYDESDIEMPSTFTPKAESIDELIKESIIHVKGIEYTNKETQRDILLDLLQAAAITRAVHWRQVDPKKDIKSQILESIKGSADLSEKLENPLAKEDDPSKPKHSKDWEDFLDQVEDGFGFETGIEDAQTPYGRSRERRPRIRQIGDNIGQAGKPNG
jgi:hypothetical protein